ncbi:MAG: DUF2182 domain-containing protein [Hyphomonadaceae bacterium]
MTQSADTALEALLKRDRVIVGATLGVIVLACWAYIVWLSMRMQSPSPAMGGGMTGVTGGGDMGGMLMPLLGAWTAAEAFLMFIMWATMMVGMMLPSASPVILLYARVAQQASKDGKPFAPTSWFASGYVASWLGFSVLATGGQWLLERAALLTPMMQSASPIFGAAVLIGAGLHQWTPLKDMCLAHCQAPFAFIQSHGGFKRDASGSFFLGLRHGLYCVGCCWALMALLFVGGVMNVLWIAGLAALVFVEKLLPRGRVIARSVGAALIVAGIVVLAGGLRPTG